ncbi:MAG: cytochrome c biogenesis protein [Spirochaetales bacterium]|nr:cytochrome c biogenesis protein [Spirochaetales bacterium]
MLIYGNIIITILYLILAASYIVRLHINSKALDTSNRTLLIITIVTHLVIMILIGATRGVIALTTVSEALSALTLSIALTLLVLELRVMENSPGAFISPLIFFLQLIATAGSRNPIIDRNIIQMPLFSIHTITTIFGYTFFVYSFVLGIMHLYLLGRFKRKKFDNLFFELPPLMVLEKLNIIALIAGFILLSVGLVTGISLAYIVWKTVPFSDPKIYLSLILWVIYLLSLLTIVIFKLKGRMMSYCSIIGFILILVIFMVESFTNTTIHKF